jgi:uncharacterized protein (TIGR02270 family)
MSTQTLSPAAPERLARPIVPVVVQQHVEEAAALRHVRTVLVRAPHVGLLQLGRLDERIEAHLDGLAVAGDAGKAMALAALDRPGAGEVFALAVRALQDRDQPLLDHLLALWPELPDARRGLISAFGWVPAATLQGVVRVLLDAPAAHARELGLAACRLHHADPGPLLDKLLADKAPTLRAAAARAAGELGRVDLLPALQAGADDAAPDVAFWSAWSAVLLGDRGKAKKVLADTAVQDTRHGPNALAMLMACSTHDEAGDFARHISNQARAPDASTAAQRRLVRALALLGDLRFVPWLITRMAEPPSARLAGEAFQWITGADLARQDLETLNAPPMPEQPSASATDDDVAMDEDDSLPWPDPGRVQRWWDTQGPALQAAGGRLFMGRPLGLESARQVLVDGTQRQRAYAALCCSLLQPGRKLFQVAAPTQRQKRWLAGAQV